MKKCDEAFAAETVHYVIQACAGLAQTAKGHFDRAVETLEKEITDCILIEDPIQERDVSVVSLDVARFGSHARVVYNYIDAHGLYVLHERIQQELLHALKSSGISSEDVIYIDTGDGALLIFSEMAPNNTSPVCAKEALEFTHRFLEAAAAKNIGIDQDNQLQFRIGIATGKIAASSVRVRNRAVVVPRVAGIPLSKAVRLQSASKPGEVIICAQTHASIPLHLKEKFGGETDIPGKPHETASIKAHRPC